MTTQPLPIPHIPLPSHSAIPQLGFGTYKIAAEEVAQQVKSALAVGYRHVDTAQMYGTERAVGEGWRASGKARSELFLTSKLANGNHEPEEARRSLARTLADLQVDYLDLFLIHWPLPMHYGGDFVTTYRVLEEFVAAGKVRAIGVSNFQPEHLEQLAAAGCLPPAVNQVEVHPYFTNLEVVNYCRGTGIPIVSWSPLGRGKELADPVVQEIAAQVNATAAQVILAWHLAKGYVAIPKASSAQRQAENLGALQVQLTVGQIEQLDQLNRGEAGRTGPHPNLMDRL